MQIHTTPALVGNALARATPDTGPVPRSGQRRRWAGNRAPAVAIQLQGQIHKLLGFLARESAPGATCSSRSRQGAEPDQILPRGCARATMLAPEPGQTAHKLALQKTNSTLCDPNRDADARRLLTRLPDQQPIETTRLAPLGQHGEAPGQQLGTGEVFNHLKCPRRRLGQEAGHQPRNLIPRMVAPAESGFCPLIWPANFRPSKPRGEILDRQAQGQASCSSEAPPPRGSEQGPGQRLRP